MRLSENERTVMTMAEYIERETLKERIFRRVNNELIRSWLCRIIDELSPADVAPVRHGRWIEQEKYTFGTLYDCSICDNRILDNGHSWNYCPNCGAKMGGSSNEE